jgi:hypothetical protein
MVPHTDTPRTLRMCDVECYVNYFLVKFYDPATDAFDSVVLNAWTPLDTAKLVRLLATSTIVTFNGRKYDEPMIIAALAGYNNAQLKALTNAIIGNNMQPWELEREFGLAPLPYLDHIDLIEVLPGQASLKAYGGKLHCKKIQDLPYPHDAILTPAQMDETDEYCGNDLTTNAAAYFKFEELIDLRRDLSKQYGIDLRSKSDAQIAEAIFKKTLPFKVEPPFIPPGTPLLYKKPAFVSFRSEQLNRALAEYCNNPFLISPTGGIAPHVRNRFIDWSEKQQRLDDRGMWLTRPRGWECERITIGAMQYQMGIGGLHSCEKTVHHLADDNTSMQDIDVISYYPEIMCQLQLYPPQIGPVFLDIFSEWKAHRVAAKKAKKKRQANAEKTKINGTFGKTGSRYSILNAPSMMIQITITGQLCLLMLIEMLEGAGINVVSANTDGVVVKCPRHMHDMRNMIVKHWETVTGFETEAAEYRAIFLRDVNNYMAFKDDGEVKLKGEAFAPPEPVGPSWPNPTNEICVDACKEYILNGTPVEHTIRQCSDIRKFVNVRAVAGGGEWVRSDGSKHYLGKAVRWYYARGERGYIGYTKNGNRVARSEGCKPCMTLPDVLPPDIDYNWYVQEAYEKLRSVGL